MKDHATWRRLLRDETGASSVEYAILGALIIAVCVIAIALLGEQTKELFERLKFWE